MNDLASEETVIVATYTARRGAEMARDHLDRQGIDAFIRADDAGGMHPQLQRPHGVELVVLDREGERAAAFLESAGLLPDEAPESPADPDDKQEDPSDLTFSASRPLVSGTGLLYLVVFALMVGGILIGLIL
jgi:hypothetical protein